MRPGQRMKNDIDVFKKKRICTSLSWHKSGARHFENGNKSWVPIMDPCVEYCIWNPKFLGEFCFVLKKKNVSQMWVCLREVSLHEVRNKTKKCTYFYIVVILCPCHLLLPSFLLVQSGHDTK